MAYDTVTLNISNENLVYFYGYLNKLDEEQWNRKVFALLKVTKQRRLEGKKLWS